MRHNHVNSQDHLSEELLNMYVDGELSTRERNLVEAHLTSCNACQDELSALQQLFVALDDLGPAAAPDLVPSVLKRVGSPPHPRAVAGGLRALPWLTAALQAIAVLALLVWGWSHLADLWSAVNGSLLPETVSAALSRVSAWASTQWTTLSAWPRTVWTETQAGLARLSTSTNLPFPQTQLVMLAAVLVVVWLLGNALLLRRALLNGQVSTHRRYRNG
jgi:anti-sigma factor RsiW